MPAACRQPRVGSACQNPSSAAGWSGLKQSLVSSLARTTRGAALTEAGVTFRDHAARACAEIDLARETILPAGDLRGRLRIAAPLSFGPTHLAPVLAQLARRHPRLHLQCNYSDRFVDIVGEGFDCAIRVGHLSDSNLVARRIAPIRGKLVASPEYVREHGAPETPDQLLAQTWTFINGDRTITVHPQGRFKADNGMALAAAAVAGLGIAALPEFLLEKELASGALVALMNSYPLTEIGIYIVRPPGHHPARKVRVLTELLIEHFG
jgi:DNA-binding transcriptional LysR family regulator